jgi:hypothetical protein
MENISANELSETLNLLHQIKNRISDYCHIEEFIDDDIIQSIDKQINELTELENKLLQI